MTWLTWQVVQWVWVWVMFVVASTNRAQHKWPHVTGVSLWKPCSFFLTHLECSLSSHFILEPSQHIVRISSHMNGCRQVLQLTDLAVPILWAISSLGQEKLEKKTQDDSVALLFQYSQVSPRHCEAERQWPVHPVLINFWPIQSLRTIKWVAFTPRFWCFVLQQ